MGRNSDIAVLGSSPVSRLSNRQCNSNVDSLKYAYHCYTLQDPLYNSSIAWGSQKAKGGVYLDADSQTEASFLEALANPTGRPTKENLETSAKIHLSPQLKIAITELRKTRDVDDAFPRYRDTTKDDEDTKNVAKPMPLGTDGEYCPICGLPLLPDPKPNQLCIWLHAKRYSTESWDFETTELPSLADADWVGWEEAMGELEQSKSAYAEFETG